MLLFGKTYIFIIWKEPICGRLRSMAVQQMSVLLLQIFCFLLSGSQEYVVLFMPLLVSFFSIFTPPPATLSLLENNTAYNQKQIFLLLLFVGCQLMIIRKELTLVLNKKENYVNKKFFLLPLKADEIIWANLWGQSGHFSLLRATYICPLCPRTIS